MSLDTHRYATPSYFRKHYHIWGRKSVAPSLDLQISLIACVYQLRLVAVPYLAIIRLFISLPIAAAPASSVCRTCEKSVLQGRPEAVPEACSDVI